MKNLWFNDLIKFVLLIQIYLNSGNRNISKKSVNKVGQKIYFYTYGYFELVDQKWHWSKTFSLLSLKAVTIDSIYIYLPH